MYQQNELKNFLMENRLSELIKYFHDKNIRNL